MIKLPIFENSDKPGNTARTYQLGITGDGNKQDIVAALRSMADAIDNSDIRKKMGAPNIEDLNHTSWGDGVLELVITKIS